MKNQETNLPAWLYPLGFWLAVVMLCLGLLVPKLAIIGVISVGITPVIAAMVVAALNIKSDRSLSLAALGSLLGLVVVFFARQLAS